MGKTRKFFAVGSLALSLIVGLSSCKTTEVVAPDPDPKEQKPPIKKRTPSADTPADDTPPDLPDDTTPEPDDDPKVDPNPGADDTTPKPDSPEAVAEDYKFGIPVPGRIGMIKSPHAPTAGLIDARGLKPGTKIRCPFSSKVIRVP